MSGIVCEVIMAIGMALILSLLLALMITELLDSVAKLVVLHIVPDIKSRIGKWRGRKDA